MATQVFVVKNPRGGWDVKVRGTTHGTYRTQTEAASAGRLVAVANRGELVIQGEDGRIRSKDSFGNDPFPPRDRER